MAKKTAHVVLLDGVGSYVFDLELLQYSIQREGERIILTLEGYPYEPSENK